MPLSRDEHKIKQALLALIHTETGWGDPLEPRCEFEELTLAPSRSLDDDLFAVPFKYLFDEDGFSQYDKSHRLVGEAIFDATYEILSFSLTEVHTGGASNFDPYYSTSDVDDTTT